MKNNKEKYCKKALIVTTVASTLDQFCMNDISILQNCYEVYVAANFLEGNNTSKERIQEFKSELQRKSIGINEINFNRNPFSKSNFIAYREVKKLISTNFFEIIHCHTPIAAMLVRIAAIKTRKRGTKVIYTAHGFHFFKGAPLINWLLYYPIERLLARYTDVLITINKEDYSRASKSFKARSVKYIPGIGIDIEKFSRISVNKFDKRNELGFQEGSFIILSVGELNKNKNHEIIIKAMEKLNNENIYYIICGQGGLESYLKNMVKNLELDKQVKFMGYRKDIADISKLADIFILPSVREGLSVALMEAMALELPVICSNIRGNVDLVDDGENGYLIEKHDVEGFVKSIKMLYESKELRKKFSEKNIEKIKLFSVENVTSVMNDIYFML